MAGAAAIAGGGSAGVGVSGAGVSDLNTISVNTAGYRRRGGGTITTGGVIVAASDASTINAIVGAASIAGGFGGAAGVAVSIGISIARNTIDDSVAAYIAGVGSLSSGGNAVSVTATEGADISAIAVTASFAAGGGGAAGVAVSGGGALANNIIGVDTQAYISGSTLTSVGDVTVGATETGSISALIAAVSASVGGGGAAGVGVSIGLTIANNAIAASGNALGTGTGKVFAYILDSSISGSGAVAVDATSSETISALVLAGSAALTAGGAAGVGVSFGGAFGFNEVSVSTRAYVDGGTGTNDATPTYSITSSGLSVAAMDTATITAGVGAASIAVSLGGAAGVSVTVALSVARNTVNDDQQAYITGVKSLLAGSGTVSVEATEDATINAGAFAASLAAGISGVAGVAVSGAATITENLIEAKVDAYISNSSIGSAGDVTVSASDTSTINAITDAASAALGGGIAGVGVAVGAALAHNAIGNGTTGETAPGEVKAYISDTAIAASGALTLTTLSEETIEAQVGTVAAAISGGFVGVSAAGAGAVALNDIAVNVSGYIDGDTAAGSSLKGVSAASVSLVGNDTSTITAEVDAVAITAAFGVVGVSVSIGISQATNQIDNNLEVYIANASDGVTATGSSVALSATDKSTVNAQVTAASLAISGGLVGVSVAGAGAEATNVVLNDTNAYFSNSTITATTDVTTSAKSEPTINAEVFALSAAFVAAFAGASGSLGFSLAENFIGYTGSGVQQPDDVKAYSTGTSISAGGAFNETATDHATIDANVAALSAAVTAAIGGSLSGAGANAINKIAVDTEATVTGSGSTGISADTLDLSATDTTTIDAFVGSVALAAALGGSASVSVSTAENLIDNTVQASIDSADVTTSGAATVDATEDATISAISVAAALSGGLVSASGGGAIALNTIDTTISAFVESSTLDVGSLSIDAQDTSSASAATGAASIALGFISIAAGGSAATDTITNTVSGYIDLSTVNAGGGNVAVSASAQPEGYADADGVTAGTLAVGASVALVTVTPTVSATVGGTITAGNLSILANVNLPSDNAPAAQAVAQGSVGALIGVVASDAETTNTATVTAGIGSHTDVTAATATVVALSGALLIVAGGDTEQEFGRVKFRGRPGRYRRCERYCYREQHHEGDGRRRGAGHGGHGVDQRRRQ